MNFSARKPLAWWLFLLVTAAILCGCSGDAPEPDRQVLERGLGQEPESMDPHHAQTTQAHAVQRDLFEGLLSYSPVGDLVPGAAESWSISDDGLRYEFRLRENGRWSNGEPVVADDFVFSLRRLVDPGTAAFYAESLSAIENAPAIVGGDKPTDTLGVEAVNDHTLVIRLVRPVPYFLDLLTHPSTFPVNRKSLETHRDQFARPGNLVSNGAYKLDEWVLGSVIEISRNEHYWDAANTSIERVRHHIVQEPAVELNRYRAGELHTTSTVPANAFGAVRKQFGDQLRVAPMLSVYFYGINLTNPMLGDNPTLREALSMAIDREVLVRDVIGRGEPPAYSFVPPGVRNYDGPQLRSAAMTADERKAEARRLYAAAGYGNGNPPAIELRYNTSATHRQIALAVQEMWSDVLDFDATLINEEFRVLVANMKAMQVTQVFRLSWNGDYNDANSFLSLFESDNPSNMFGYADDYFDELMADAAVQTDPDTRRLFLEEAERELLAAHTVIPLYFPVSKHLVQSIVLGWQDNVLDYHYSQNLSFADPDR